jgi:hypothetical protein
MHSRGARASAVPRGEPAQAVEIRGARRSAVEPRRRRANAARRFGAAAQVASLARRGARRAPASVGESSNSLA